MKGCLTMYSWTPFIELKIDVATIQVNLTETISIVEIYNETLIFS